MSIDNLTNSLLARRTRRFLRAQSAIYAEIMPLESLGENLKIRTQFSARLGGAWDFWMNKRTIMTNKEGRNNNEFYEQAPLLITKCWDHIRMDS